MCPSSTSGVGTHVHTHAHGDTYTHTNTLRPHHDVRRHRSVHQALFLLFAANHRYFSLAASAHRRKSRDTYIDKQTHTSMQTQAHKRRRHRGVLYAYSCKRFLISLTRTRAHTKRTHTNTYRCLQLSISRKCRAVGIHPAFSFNITSHTRI